MPKSANTNEVKKENNFSSESFSFTRSRDGKFVTIAFLKDWASLFTPLQKKEIQKMLLQHFKTTQQVDQEKIYKISLVTFNKQDSTLTVTLDNKTTIPFLLAKKSKPKKVGFSISFFLDTNVEVEIEGHNEIDPEEATSSISPHSLLVPAHLLNVIERCAPPSHPLPTPTLLFKTPCSSPQATPVNFKSAAQSTSTHAKCSLASQPNLPRLPGIAPAHRLTS